jgi:putative membrane protein
MRNLLLSAFAGGICALAPLAPSRGQDSDGRRPPIKAEERKFDFRGLTDEQFAENAALINLMEINLGNYAVLNARRADIQQFANQLKKEHTEANNLLEMIAAKRRLTLPTKLDAKHQAKIDKLIVLPPDEFDRAYVKEMVDGHRMATALYEHESQNGRVAELKAYAAETLPTVRRHYQRATQLWNDYFVSLR